MLILTRKLGESINIGENIQLKVLKVRGSQVQLGIAAPHEIQVLRQEIVGKELRPELGKQMMSVSSFNS